MALLQPGPIGVFSGNLGGLCAAPSKSGHTLRARKGKNPSPSPAQRAQQLTIAQYTSIWRSAGMTDMRKAWNTYARNHIVPNRMGTPRLVSGYAAWLHFLPIVQTFYPAATLMLGPPACRNTDYMTTISATISNAPSMIVVAPGVWNYPFTYEQVQFARFQPTSGIARRPIWQNLVFLYLKVYATTDVSSWLPQDAVPVPGETWQVRIRWWSVYYDSGLASYSVDREPTSWLYASATA
jgi:hypothetical protein